MDERSLIKFFGRASKWAIWRWCIYRDVHVRTKYFLPFTNTRETGRGKIIDNDGGRRKKVNPWWATFLWSNLMLMLMLCSCSHWILNYYTHVQLLKLKLILMLVLVLSVSTNNMAKFMMLPMLPMMVMMMTAVLTMMVVAWIIGLTRVRAGREVGWVLLNPIILIIIPNWPSQPIIWTDCFDWQSQLIISAYHLCWS